MVLAGILKKLLFGKAFTTERGRIRLFGRMEWIMLPSRALAKDKNGMAEHCGKAKVLIEECGYHRRDGEVCELMSDD